MIDLLKTCLGKSLDDVSIHGIVDTNDKPADFLPLMDYIFITIGGASVRLLRHEVSLRLSVSITDEAPVFCEFEEGHLPCRSRIGSYVLADPNSDQNQIKRFVLYGVASDSFAAFEIQLESGQMLFFDPTFIDGINFGGQEQKAIWLSNSELVDSIVIE